MFLHRCGIIVVIEDYQIYATASKAVPNLGITEPRERDVLGVVVGIVVQQFITETHVPAAERGYAACYCNAASDFVIGPVGHSWSILLLMAQLQEDVYHSKQYDRDNES